jgi:hypothetical protein
LGGERAYYIRGVGRVSASMRQESALQKQFEFASPGEGLSTVLGTEFSIDVARVRLDRAYGDEEVPGDLGVGPAGREEVQHLKLPLAQWVVEPSGCSAAFGLRLRRSGNLARRLVTVPFT